MDKNAIKNPNLNCNDNCNPIDLSVIIKSNLLKNSNWNNTRFLGGSSTVDHDKPCFRKAMFSPPVIDYNSSKEGDNENHTYNNTRNNFKEDEEDVEVPIVVANFHDENRNIKVE